MVPQPVAAVRLNELLEPVPRPHMDCEQGAAKGQSYSGKKWWRLLKTHRLA